MPDNSVDTVRLHHLVRQWQAGDRSAIEELLRASGRRLEALARAMLRGFSNLRDWYDTGDVVQGSTMRLLNVLRKLQPQHTRDFFNLAATQIRRELLDLARRFRGKGTIPL